MKKVLLNWLGLTMLLMGCTKTPSFRVIYSRVLQVHKPSEAIEGDLLVYSNAKWQELIQRWPNLKDSGIERYDLDAPDTFACVVTNSVVGKIVEGKGMAVMILERGQEATIAVAVIKGKKNVFLRLYRKSSK